MSTLNSFAQLVLARDFAPAHGKRISVRFDDGMGECTLRCARFDPEMLCFSGYGAIGEPLSVPTKAVTSITIFLGYANGHECVHARWFREAWGELVRFIPQ